jgi:hypothetical protein
MNFQTSSEVITKDIVLLRDFYGGERYYHGHEGQKVVNHVMRVAWIIGWPVT